MSISLLSNVSRGYCRSTPSSKIRRFPTADIVQLSSTAMSKLQGGDADGDGDGH